MSRQLRIAMSIWPFALGMLIVLLINRMEHQFMPVVSDFTATTMQREGGKLRMGGYMRKDRNCVYAGASASAINADGKRVSIPLVFQDATRDATANRPTGTQAWGPWSLEIPLAPSIQEITLRSIHQCHLFWATTTDLTTIPVINEIAP